MEKPRLYRGMRDYLPREMLLRENVLEKIRKIFRSWGYVPLETPAIELLSTLLGKYGDEADKLIYRIEHEDGLGLRYDLTVPLARVIALYENELPKPFRRYQIQPVWRAERAQKQKGRFREFIQCDVDIVGTESPVADAEILAIAAQTISELGFNNFTILLNHRQILRGIIALAGFTCEDEATVLRSIDKWDKIGKSGVEAELCEKGFEREQIKEIFQLVEREGNNWELLSSYASLGDDRITAGVENLRAILKNLFSLGVGQDLVRFSPRMARGLDYYTGAIFEAYLGNLPQLGSVSAGGRYDDLVGMFCGRKVPASGVTIGLDRIISAMEELGLIPQAYTYSKVLVTLFSEGLENDAINLSHNLRKAGVSVELYPEPAKLAKQFAYADKWKIPYVIVIGEEEAAHSLCVLKDMSTGQQRTLSQEEVVRILSETSRK